MKLNPLKLSSAMLMVISVAVITACSSPEPKQEESTEMEMESTDEAVVEEVTEVDWMVHEDGFGDVKLRADKDPADAIEKMDPITHEEFIKTALPVHLDPIPYEVEVTEIIIPLMETETLTAYTEKGKDKGSVQVVHDGETGEVISVTYHGKNHKDEYTVQPGMSAKEAKKLRKDLKHMEHRGEYFLYSDVSNIMYILDVKDSMGNEFTEAEIDEISIEAIVWKDKKHHTDMAEIQF